MPAAIPVALMVASAVGSAASKAAKNRAEGRQAEAAHLQNQDAAALTRAESDRQAQFDLAKLDLDRRETSSKLTDDNISRAKRGGALEGMEDISFDGIPDYIKSRMPTIKGGKRPSAIKGGKELGSTVRAKAMDALLAGEKFSDVNLGTLPGVSEPPKPTGFDKALGLIGTIGGAAGTANALYGAGKTPAAPVTGLSPHIMKPGGLPDALTGNPVYNRR